jgi:predicted neuraminidase
VSRINHPNNIVDLSQVIGKGRLFRHHEMDQVQAYIPTSCRSNHASSLVELDNGDLLCAWFAGSNEGTSDIKIYVSQLKHGHSVWSEPVRLSEDFTRSEQNPVLFQAPNGQLWAIYTAQQTRGCSLEEWKRRLATGGAKGPFILQDTSEIRYRISNDRGATWSPIRTLFGKPGSFCRHSIVVLSNGDWLFSMWYSSLADGTHYGGDYTVMQISRDQGTTWKEYPVPESRGRVHASVIELENGKLVAFFRSRSADRIYISRSEDYGRTWTAPQRTVLPNNNASIRAIKLQSGTIALIFNPVSVNEDPSLTVWPYDRCPVTIALSEDGGVNWPYMRHIETGESFCGERNRGANKRYEYPYIIQAKDGLLHVTYSHASRKCIKYSRISEDWIRG